MSLQGLGFPLLVTRALSTLGPTYRGPRKLTSNSFGYLLQGWLWVVPQQCVDGHHHPWAAEATLCAMTLGKSFLGGNSTLFMLQTSCFPTLDTRKEYNLFI